MMTKINNVNTHYNFQLQLVHHQLEVVQKTTLSKNSKIYAYYSFYKLQLGTVLVEVDSKN